jgi:hypothetical protein
VKCSQCKHYAEIGTDSIDTYCVHPDNIKWVFSSSHDTGRAWVAKRSILFLNVFYSCKKGEYSEKYKQYLKWRKENESSN